MKLLPANLEHPWAVLLLALMPILTAIGWVARGRAHRLAAQLGGSLAPAGRQRWALRFQRFVVSLVFSLLFGALVFGVAGPRWGKDPLQAVSLGRDLVVVVDLSRSMLAQDVLPDRLGRARAALDELGRRMMLQGGHRLALVGFAARGQVLCPLTTDYDHWRHALADLDPSQLPAIRPGGKEALSGTRIGAGLMAALAACEGGQRGYQDILLLSDGDDPADDEEWRQGALAALAQAVPVHAIGIGDPGRESPIPVKPDTVLRHQGQAVMTRLNEDPLRELARMTGGVYVPARTDLVPLAKLFAEVIEPKRKLEVDRDALPLPKQQYHWFFAAALGLFCLELVLGPGGMPRRRSHHREPS